MRAIWPGVVTLSCVILGATILRGDQPEDVESRFTPKIEFYYPHDGETVFSIPHVLLIFDVKKANFNPDRIRVEIDGREVPKDAIKGCAICAGPRPALMAHRVPWGLTEGKHTAAIIVRPPEAGEVRSEITYTVDTTVPSFSGLTGFIEFPDAQVATSKSIRAGLVHNGRERDGTDLWLVGTRPFDDTADGKSSLPIEAGVTAQLPEDGPRELKYSLKVGLREQSGHTPSVGVGFRENDPFAAIGWHLNPSTFNISAGIGGSDLPRGFLGASWGPEIFRVVGEYGTEGQFNYGLMLYHPYGFRAGVYRVERPGGDHPWLMNLNFSRQW